jgi:hypothetical protein
VKTQTRNGRRNGSKSTPDLMSTLKRGPGRPRKQPTRSAEEIAADLEYQGRQLLAVAAILRGEV